MAKILPDGCERRRQAPDDDRTDTYATGDLNLATVPHRRTLGHPIEGQGRAEDGSADLTPYGAATETGLA